jgi:hypothetical protein
MTDFINSDSRGKSINLIRIGKVVDNSDQQGIGALKVRLDGGADKDDNDTNLVNCIPLLPKYLNIMPDVGEGVYVFSAQHNDALETNQKSQRFWFGPIISQQDKLDGEEKENGIRGLYKSWTKPDKPFSEIDTANGLYPNKKEIAIQGRGSGDLIFKKDQTILRIGKFKEDSRLKFNDVNLGYIQLKDGDEDLKKEFKTEEIEVDVFTPPDFFIKVDVRSILSDGIILEQNLTPEEYSVATQHEASVTKINYKTNKIEDNFDPQTSQNFNTRIEALNAVEQILSSELTDGNKWQLQTRVKEILEVYGEEEQNSFNTYIVTYPGSTKKEKRTKTKLEFSKANSGVKSSIINVVADRINLVSHDGEHTYELTDNEKLITPETQNDIHTTAQSIVFGEKLVEFLELVKNYVNSHIHPFSGLPADPEASKLNVLNFDLQTILNKNIKTK